MRVALFCAGAVAAWTTVVAPVRAADPSDTLVRAAQASRVTTYQGVILYRGDEQFEVLKIQHRFKDGSEREHLVALTGEPRQLLRVDNRLICILPRDHTVSIDRPAGIKSFIAQLNSERLRQLAQWYSFRDQGKGRIAGRDCTGVAVLPRDDFRYGYEVWADKETGMPLKVSLIDQGDVALEQVMFTEVSFPRSIDDAQFAEPKVGDASKFQLVSRDLPSLYASPSSSDAPQVSFQKLPPGYRVVAREQRPLPDSQNGRIEHLLLSDGLSAVSVFSAVEQQAAEKAPGDVRAGAVEAHMGPVEAYGRMMGSYHITIVGEVPTPAIQMIGEGVRPVLPLDDLTPDLPPADAPSGSGGAQ